MYCPKFMLMAEQIPKRGEAVRGPFFYAACRHGPRVVRERCSGRHPDEAPSQDDTSSKWNLLAAWNF